MAEAGSHFSPCPWCGGNAEVVGDVNGSATGGNGGNGGATGGLGGAAGVGSATGGGSAINGSPGTDD